MYAVFLHPHTHSPPYALRGDTGRDHSARQRDHDAAASTMQLRQGNEMLTALNKPEDWWLAVVLVDGEQVAAPTCLSRPFQREPDFAATSVNYEISKLLSKSTLS